MPDDARQLAQALQSALQAPIESLEALKSLLVPPLLAFGFYDSTVETQDGPLQTGWTSLSERDRTYILRTQWQGLQSVLATKIVVDWLDQLAREALQDKLLTPFFCPEPSAPFASQVAVLSMSTLLSILSNRSVDNVAPKIDQTTVHPLVKQHALSMLGELMEKYTLDRLFRDIVTTGDNPSSRLLKWQAAVVLYLSLPVKVANMDLQEVPQSLEWRPVLRRATYAFEALLEYSGGESGTVLQAAAYLLGKLAKSGFMSHNDKVSFWTVLLPSVRVKLLKKAGTGKLEAAWQSVTAEIVSTDLLQISSAYFTLVQDVMGPKAESKVIKQQAALASRIFGSLSGNRDYIWDGVIAKCFLQRLTWNTSMSRLVVAWACISVDSGTAQARLLSEVSEVWCEASFIAHCSAGSQAYLATMIVLLVHSLPPMHTAVIQLSRRPEFLKAITLYLGHLQPSIRLCGMLLAETVSQRSLPQDGSIKPLNFDETWSEDGSEHEIVNEIRLLARAPADWEFEAWDGDTSQSMNEKDPSRAPERGMSSQRAESRHIAIPSDVKTNSKKVVVLSSDYDDYEAEDEADLPPYAMPENPPVEQLKDLEDPSAYTPNKKKVKPPVYIADLSAYLKQTEDAEKVDVALNEAANLIRRKAAWGTELHDSAVDLAFALVGLQDNFNLKNFEDRRRAALTALLVSSPQKAVPAITEQYFSNSYSVMQRFAMLSSLAIGARELAGLPVPVALTHKTSDAGFASQKLPSNLHQHYIGAQAEEPDEDSILQQLVQSIESQSLSETRREAEFSIPSAAREKLLSVRSSKVRYPSARETSKDRHQPVYHELAVTTFIMPLINRFWLYLRDAATSPQDRRLGPYSGGRAGTAPLLEPMMLTKFLSALTVMLDASRHSPHFLAILAPEALELVLSLRSIEDNSDEVNGAILQVVLQVLDASNELDGGRTLARDYTKLIWQIKDWTEAIWAHQQSRGELTSIGRCAAGVLLRIDSVIQKTIGYHQ